MARFQAKDKDYDGERSGLHLAVQRQTLFRQLNEFQSLRVRLIKQRNSAIAGERAAILSKVNVEAELASRVLTVDQLNAQVNMLQENLNEAVEKARKEGRREYEVARNTY